MASTLRSVHPRPEPMPLPPVTPEMDDGKDSNLLLQAFEMFTQASSSLESVFQNLQMRAERLSKELEAKNRELKKSLREKAEVQSYLKTILESLPCGVLTLDLSGKVTLCNPVATQILDEPQGRAFGTKKKSRSLRDSVLREFFASSLQIGGTAVEMEIPVVSAERTRILATSGTPLTDTGGTQIGTLHIIRDITEMKRLQEQNKRGERLSAMGEMACELAHEIRNPLGSIELFASLLENALPEGSDAARWADNIRVGSRSLNNIVSNMLHFANPLAPNFSEVDLHEVVREVLGFTEAITRQRDIQVRQDLTAADPLICADRELLKQMMLNLIMNAMQAMPSRGTLEVLTQDVAELPGGAPCKGIRLVVSDTGVGIPPENLGRIFDPFFTTNKNGTGLGLSVVHQIVDRHSGFISVESEQNTGTRFTIVMPSRIIVNLEQVPDAR